MDPKSKPGNVERGVILNIYCPELFQEPEFIAWLQERSNDNEVATWHIPGQEPNEYSDVFCTYDDGEGSNSDMPGWDAIVTVCRWHDVTHATLRLINMEP